jgi:hypothetical protein
MRVKRLLAVPWLAVPLLASAAPGFAAPGAPTSLAPAKTAWFDQSYPTATATPPPLPAGVTADDLYVAGATVPVKGLPVVSVPAGASMLQGILAVTAMSFRIPDGVSPASLTLVLASTPSTAAVGGSAPTGVTLEACPTTSDFQPGGHQPYDQVPAYDCSGRTSVSSLSDDGTSVVFSDIARVARGKVLSFVIRPGTTGADRLVFAAPTSRALSLLNFDSAPVFTPAGTVPSPAQTSGSVEQPRAGRSPDLETLGVPRLGPVAASAGEVAPDVGHAPSTVRLARPVGAVATDDSRVRLLALAGLALLLSGVGWLAFTDQRDEPVDQQWGFGRYRRHREGQAPAL